MNSFWRYCLTHFEKELPAQQFATWIKPLKFEADGDTFTLIAPNRFVLQWITGQVLRPHTGARRQSNLKRSVDIKLLLAEKEPVQPTLPVARGSGVPQPKPARDISRLNPAFTFETFVTGKANELARAAAMQVAERAGRSLQPALHLRRRRPGQDAS